MLGTGRGLGGAAKGDLHAAFVAGEGSKRGEAQADSEDEAKFVRRNEGGSCGKIKEISDETVKITGIPTALLKNNKEILNFILIERSRCHKLHHMNRIATTLTTLTASVLLGQTLGAAEPSLQSLDSRLGSLEARLISIEKALTEDHSSYTYNNAATLEATKGTTTSATTPLSATAPATTTPSVTPATTASQTYVIQDGDTLGKIATKFGVERKALLEANRLSEGQPIYIGETLMVPVTAHAVRPLHQPPLRRTWQDHPPEPPAPPVPTWPVGRCEQARPREAGLHCRR